MKSGALILLACSMAATAAGGATPAGEPGRLTAGVQYPPPAYAAGAKFRTPELPEAALAGDIAQRMHVPVETVRVGAGEHAQALRDGRADIVFAALPADDPQLRAANVIPTGYTAGPMAIMRTDTRIKRWEHLKGRTVCIAQDGRYAGTLSARYGAIEKPFRAPADALLALRTGVCDAAVHDNPLLEEMLKLPEWKKFSASLPVGPRTTLALIVPEHDAGRAAFLRRVAADWRSRSYLNEVTAKAARNIAFEVYLDQAVPDCH